MSLNCVEIEKVIDGLKKNVLIKNIFQMNKNSIVIDTYDKNAHYNILIDTTDRYNKICRIPEDSMVNKENLRFSQYLSSQFCGAKITKIYQYDFSRIVIFEIEKNNVVFRLICRLWGTAANVLLADNDNYIIESLKRLSKMNEWPQEEFIFPKNKSETINYKIREEFENGNINESVFNYYNDLKGKEDFTVVYKKIKTLIDKEMTVLENQLVKINQNLNMDHVNENLNKGELLKSNIYKIKKGEKKVIVTDYNTGTEMEIDISPVLSPSENIEKYFNKYKKMKEGVSRWLIQKDNVKQKIDKYQEILEYLNDVTTIEKLYEISGKINSGKLLKIALRKTEDKTGIPGRKFILSNNYIAYISKSAKDADKLLKLVAIGNDYWFHIRDYAGSHVIVKEIKNKQIPDDVKKEAAMLALYYSKGRNSDEGDIYFTRVKYLHRGKNNPAGLVIPTQEKNIKVTFDKNLLEKIFSRKV